MLGLVLFVLATGLALWGLPAWYEHAAREKLAIRHIRGQQVVTAPELVVEIRTVNAATAEAKNQPWHIPAELVGAPYPFMAEREHTLMLGASGSGISLGLGGTPCRSKGCVPVELLSLRDRDGRDFAKPARIYTRRYVFRPIR